MKLFHQPQTIRGAQIAALGILASGRRIISCPTQLGCVIGCSFCVSGNMTRAKGLSVEEMASMCVAALDGLGESDAPIELSYCGEGEPLMNWRACERLRADFETIVGQKLSSTRYCFSGLGSELLSRIAPSGEAPGKLRLQWSLHSPKDAKRSELMRKTQPIAQVVANMREHAWRFDSVAMNVALVEGYNDAPDDIEMLGKLGDPEWTLLLNPLMSHEGIIEHPRASAIEMELKSAGRKVQRFSEIGREICDQGIYGRLASDAMSAG